MQLQLSAIDIFRAAVFLEESGAGFYTESAKEAVGECQKLLLRLASMELGHAKRFQSLLEELIQKAGTQTGESSEEETAFVRALTSDRIITSECRLNPGDTQEAILEKAILLEKNSVNGFTRLDSMFLENGKRVDPYYQRRRQKLTFFLIECRTSFENCFCVTMDSNTTDSFSVALRFEPERVSVQIKDERFAEYFSPKGLPSDFSPDFVRENLLRVDVPDLVEMPPCLYHDKLWDEYEGRCIACGRCNTSCVTCTCFSTIDLFYSDSRQCGERRRVWDGCHLDGFADMAGGLSFRKKKSERMRFKTFHKTAGMAQPAW
ncbi:MAG: 4Fe-4S dicluster domain-containing protein [Candidatus Ozemobacteraceae bacterium]